MQVEEESPKQYVDIARGPDEEMRPARMKDGPIARRQGIRLLARAAAGLALLAAGGRHDTANACDIESEAARLR